MDGFTSLVGEGFGLITPWSVALLFIGVVLGNIAAAIPGIGAIQAMALFLPFSLYMDPLPALAMLVGLYTGGNFGGCIPAILLGTPGTPESAATLLDGYPMGQKGQAGKALKVALWSGVTADFAAGVVTLVGTVALAPLALKVGPPEHFALVVLALTLLAVLGRGTALKGVVAVAAGLLFAAIGRDPVTGQERLTFGVLEFSSGLSLVPVIIGLFSISELFYQFSTFSRQGTDGALRSHQNDDQRFSFSEYRKIFREICIGGGIGICIAILPGLGAAVAAYVAYGLAKQTSKISSKFGTGIPQGVAATESANSGTVGPTLIPLITLGIPGSPTAAVFLAAFLLQGVRVGPLAIEQHGGLIYGLFLILLLGTVANLTGGYVIRSIAPHVLRIPSHYLYPTVLVLTIIGAYAVALSLVDVQVALAFGVLGYLMRVRGFPRPPLLIAFILGGAAESSLRTSLLIFGGSAMGFVTRPATLFILLLAVLAVIAMKRMAKPSTKDELEQTGTKGSE